MWRLALPKTPSPRTLVWRTLPVPKSLRRPSTFERIGGSPECKEGLPGRTAEGIWRGFRAVDSPKEVPCPIVGLRAHPQAVLKARRGLLLQGRMEEGATDPLLQQRPPDRVALRVRHEGVFIEFRGPLPFVVCFETDRVLKGRVGILVDLQGPPLEIEDAIGGKPVHGPQQGVVRRHPKRLGQRYLAESISLANPDFFRLHMLPQSYGRSLSKIREVIHLPALPTTADMRHPFSDQTLLDQGANILRHMPILDPSAARDAFLRHFDGHVDRVGVFCVLPKMQ